MSALPLGITKATAPTIPPSGNFKSGEFDGPVISNTYPTTNNELATKEYVDDISQSSQVFDYFKDPIPSGTLAETYYIPISKIPSKLNFAKGRVEVPMSSGESAVSTFWRYRTTSDDVFSITQMSNDIIIDSSTESNVWQDFDSTILPIDLDTTTDSVVLCSTYTPGPTPSGRALNITFGFTNDSSITPVVGIPTTPLFPPC